MHPAYAKAHEISAKIIGAAIEVHRLKGPGLVEGIYKQCLLRELELRGIQSVNQQKVPVEYKGVTFEESIHLDAYADDCLVVGVKVVEKLLPVHRVQLLGHMRLLNAPIGLLFNFNAPMLKDGMARLVLEGADRP
jgi:GxxExxY protein